jgi:group I intron endonuclease
MADIACIYRIVRVGTEDCYVGQTKCLRSRKARHLGQLRRDEHHSIHLQRVYNKNGEDSLAFEVLEVIDPSTSKDVRAEMEMKWMKACDSIYNMQRASTTALGYKHTEETKRKMSLAKLGNKNAVGAIPSEEKRKAHSEFMKGKQFSLGSKRDAEQRAEISARFMGNQHACRIMPDDERQARSLNLRGRPWTEARRLAYERSKTDNRQKETA